MITSKNPWMALAASLILPGLGQVYNDQRVKGVVIAGVCAALAAGGWWISGMTRISLLLALLIIWSSAVVDAYKTAQAAGRPLEWYYRRPYIVSMLLVVGPLALPLLWRSPHFSRGARWLWTIVVVGVAALFLLTPLLFKDLSTQMPELEAALQQLGVGR